MRRNLTRLLGRLIGNQTSKTVLQMDLKDGNSWKLKTLLVGSALGVGIGLHQYNSLQMDGFYEKTIKADFQEGEKRAVQVGPKEEDTVLVVKLDGKYHCLSEKCPHFGFALSKGPMFDDKVVCPLHMASFSVISGQNEYGPVFDGLEKFEITEKNGELHIKVPKDKLNKNKTFPMSKKTQNDKRKFLIVGGGPASLSAAETLRQSGFEGEITILAKENVFPYDRTLLSKNVVASDISKIQFRDKKFFDDHDITFKGSQEVVSVDFKKNSVTTRDGSHFHYDQLLIASGGKPRIPQVEGVGLKNVFTIREWSDITKLRDSLGSTKKIVIVGASFIGLESASSIKSANKDLDITICDVSQAPIERVLGKEVGKSVQILHENNGIKFKLQTGLTKIEGKDGQVKSVKLSNGETLDADIVILGTGMAPNTQFVNGVKKDQYGGIETNVYLQSSLPNVFAAGDVATYPFFYTGQNVRIEHYNEAIFQGYIAALNMLGKKVVNDNIPFFWTRFWNMSLQYTGHTNNFDDVKIEGDLGSQKFLAWYFLNNRVVAAAAMNRIPDIMVINEAMRHNALPTAEDIKTGKATLDDIRKKIQGLGKACRCSRQKNCSGHQSKQN